MTSSKNRVGQSLLVGVLATATMDIGGDVIRRITGVAPLDYALVGRWVGHMRHGRFGHESIGDADPVPGERAIGLIAHYGVGTAFAGLLLTLSPRWSSRPTLGPALSVGLASTAAPFLVMQPAFGLGLAASQTPHPWLARFRSVRAHAVYGLGLYLGGRAVACGRGTSSMVAARKCPR